MRRREVRLVEVKWFSSRNATVFGAICVEGFNADEEPRRRMGLEGLVCGNGWRFVLARMLCG